MKSKPAYKIVFALSILFVLASFCHAENPVGRWQGEWSSISTSHRGPMKADIRSNGDGTYSARFAGRFLVVLPFIYRVDLVPSPYDPSSFVASKRLGPLLGSYTMQISFGPQTMNGRFQAAGDYGAVNMRRVSR
jgi:hypothetical protein